MSVSEAVLIKLCHYVSRDFKLTEAWSPAVPSVRSMAYPYTRSRRLSLLKNISLRRERSELNVFSGNSCRVGK